MTEKSKVDFFKRRLMEIDHETRRVKCKRSRKRHTRPYIPILIGGISF